MVPVPQYLHDAIVPHTKPQPPHILNSLALMVKTLNYGRRPLIDTFVYSSVDPSYCVNYTTMHFTGNAVLLLQSVWRIGYPIFTWKIWCELLSKHFQRGQYQLPIV
jgi:hypothetical protein